MRVLVPSTLVALSTGCLYIGDDAHQDQLDSRVDPCTASSWFADADGDGYGTADDPLEACEQPEGYVASSTDCDDADDRLHPGAQEVCDGNDQDCDNVVDNGVLLTFYPDTDNDGYGNADAPVQACALEAGTVTDGTDCNDGDANIHPGVPDSNCDGIDDNCSGTPDSEPPTWYLDFDGDLYGTSDDTVAQCQQPPGYVGVAGDCDDTLFAVNPDGVETCDGIDDDCDGAIDEEAVDRVPYYLDSDVDGFGDIDDPGILACSHATRVPNNSDCDDSENEAFPGNLDVCNDGIDNDCDGEVPADCVWPQLASPPELALAAVYGLDHAGLFGKSFLWLDIDHDGEDELLAGSEKANPVANNEGSIVVFDTDSLLGTVLESDGEYRIDGTFVEAGVGGWLTDLGDVDGDGYDDWAMHNAVYPHNAGDIDRTIRVWHDPVSADTTDLSSTLLLVHPDNTALVGRILGTSDITDDGVDDLVVGVPAHSDSVTGQGAVFVLDGTSNDTVDVTTGQAWMHSAPQSEGFGHHVRTLDFQSDGVPDLVVSAPNRMHTGNSADGVVYLIETPNTTDVDVASASWWHGRAYGHFGRWVGDAADVDDDGHEDILIGAEFTQTGSTRSGHAYLVRGPVDLDAADGGADARDFAAATFVGSADEGGAGRRIEVLGDIDGDGHTDIGIAAPDADDPSDGSTRDGEVYLVFGPLGGTYDLQVGSDDIAVIRGADNERLGQKLLGLGDVDGDGVDDFLMSGSRGKNPASGSDDEVGGVYLIAGRAGW